MSKYDPLVDFLIDSKRELISMTFEEVEDVLGLKLPQSAYKYRAWWSNNGTNSAFTRVWLLAGFKSRKVDMKKQQLEFYKDSITENSYSRQDMSLKNSGESSNKTQEGGALSRMMGVLEGTVTIYPGTDLTQPVVDPKDWNALNEDWGASKE